MDADVIEKLTELSEEEKEILGGQKNIRKGDYSLSDKFIVNSEKVLSGDKQIDLRLHTRFIDFPEHSHDYMEFMYVYKGSVTHVVNGEKLTLQSGDMLFLNRHIRHSILRAGKEDVGINFIVSNAFLQYIFHNVKDNPVMSDFLTRNFSPNGEGEYLFFKTKDVFPIRNLMDNLIYTIVREPSDNYTLLTQILSLLFCYLAHYRETLVNSLRISSPEKRLQQLVSFYIEQHYTKPSLSELAGSVGYTPAYLSGKIGKVFGKNFQTLVQEKRLQVAEMLLRTTNLSVDEIIRTVGYENQTHFHALFRRAFGVSPLRYRISKRG